MRKLWFYLCALAGAAVAAYDFDKGEHVLAAINATAAVACIVFMAKEFR